MPIKFDKNNKVFHLYNKEISYLIHISKDKGYNFITRNIWLWTRSYKVKWRWKTRNIKVKWTIS